MQKFVYIETYGCQQNEADSETLLGLCLTCGYEKTTDPRNADLILVNTCAVREHAELRALSNTGKFKGLKEKNPALLIGVCGCMAQQTHRSEEIRQKYPFVDFIFGTNLLPKFPEILEAAKIAKLKKKNRRYFRVEDFDENPGTIVEGLPKVRESKFRAWVSITYGCNNFCTYCVVPYVRGRERSREMDCVVAEVEELVRDGYREITLLGQNVNAYGKTLSPRVTFTDLLRRLDEIEGDFILRFMTSHPKDMPRETVDVIANSRHISHQLHLPLQSGSDKMLSAMHRIYNRKSYLDLCEYVRTVMPDASLSTDIIIGFPGETEEDFAETLSAIEKVRYDNVFAFLYSPRVGTPAAEYENQLSHETKTERMSRLLDVTHRISYENNQAYVGKTLRCLVESVSRNNDERMTARSTEGKLVHFPTGSFSADELIGTFRDLTIERAEATTLIAAPLIRKG